MPQQVTFDSYAAAVATDADAWSPNERTATPESVDVPYGVDDPSDADGSETVGIPEQYTTFGCVEYRPRE
ncbi:hypothetical protein [Halobaculum roseum]|uniref:Uncharacterized protein n=1 Tax=Halobaculum roseum TaxID=2175149 RepID=A0ABD5MLZ4_9EURY|nr:hypothetical protein [Halobaculum roseum]QZY03144.1 hypothetical protein K6T36_02845 [Halobaculum roseum]